MSITIDAAHSIVHIPSPEPQIPETHASRILRRHTIVTGDGMQGVLDVTDALRSWGRLVKEFAVDVRDGVGCSAVTCTISSTSAEATAFAATVRALPSVSSVEPY